MAQRQSRFYMQHYIFVHAYIYLSLYKYIRQSLTETFRCIRWWFRTSAPKAQHVPEAAETARDTRWPPASLGRQVRRVRVVRVRSAPSRTATVGIAVALTCPAVVGFSLRRKSVD